MFAINGICSFIVAFLYFINHRFAGKATILLGTAMIIWISAQVYWIGWESWLQPAFLIVGIGEMIIGYFINGSNQDHRGIFGGHHDSHAH